MSLQPHPGPAGRSAAPPPSTGDEQVDQILAEFASVGADSRQQQVQAAAEAHRRLQARLSSP
ncbi:MAG: hypothetical protein ACR2FV_13125 [Ornithinimicrobium sp.]|uniref:hypothetical protein n=1 Tax=Ornithinimicrobium sp. TaxID=1977084 RepID=UPI0017E48AD5|nr:hypothetical protein [Actinomycetota bacterium]